MCLQYFLMISIGDTVV